MSDKQYRVARKGVVEQLKFSSETSLQAHGAEV